MSRQALNGKLAGKTNDAVTARKSPNDVIAPLDYTLSVMHDEAQPTALRATMARAALPFLHSRRVSMLPMPVEDRRSDFRSRAPSTDDTPVPRRWKEKLQAADARVQASEAEAQRYAGFLRAAEQRAQVAETCTRELQKKMLVAQTHVREMADRAEAMQERALMAEARIARLEESKAQISEPARSSASCVVRDDTEVREQVAAAQHRARRAEMHAHDMEQRALAAEEIIARSR